MVLILCCPRERVSKSLYVMQLFILAGMVYYFFHGRPEKASEEKHGTLMDTQCIGETLRPVWGPEDKCYPVTWNHRTENLKWRAKLPSQRTPKVTSPMMAAPEDPKDPKDPEDFTGKAEELGPAPQEDKPAQKEAAVYGGEPPMDTGPSWVTQLLRGFWVDWFSDPNLPKTQNH